MNLNKFKYVTPVFISLNFIVQVSIRKRKKKMIKKKQIFFQRKTDSIQEKPALLAILKIL